jgi:hypothetical protein
MKKGIRHLFLTLTALATLLPRNGLADYLFTTSADSGPGSLREAVNATVTGTITFSPTVTSPIILTTGELLISSSISILGPGATNLTVDGNASSRVFEITGGQTVAVTISGLCISNGFSVGTGGGIQLDSASALTLRNCWVVGNTVTSPTTNDCAQGGGIYGAYFNPISVPNLVIENCTISGNQASADCADGAGICTFTLSSLSDCTLALNQASGVSSAKGGGIYASGGNAIIINHCTVSGNSAASVSGGGGGIFAETEEVHIGNTLIASNTVAGGLGPTSGPDANIMTYIIDNGFNLVGDTNSTPWWTASTDLVRVTPIDPLLGPLQFNGGPTPTMAPLNGSAAIDAGTSAGLTTDQRGLPRPKRFNIADPLPPGGDGSDIGAVELQLVQLYIEPSLLAGQRQFTLYWQISEPSYHLVRLLQTSRAGLLSSNWTISSLPITTINGTNRAVINSPTNNAFFRLLLAP